MPKAGSSIEFFIDKVENNTIQISKLIFKNNTAKQNIFISLPGVNNAADNSTSVPYDNTGAAKYIIIVILLYGFAIVLFIGSQVKSTRKQMDNVDSQNAEQVLQQMESTIFAKEVTNKLLDKEHRQRAWKIYLTDTSKESQTSNRNDDAYKELSGCIQEAVDNMERKSLETNLAKSSKFSLAFMKRSMNALNPLAYKKKNKNFENKKVLSKTKTPLLRLQTDFEGLDKLKESRKARQNNHDNLTAIHSKLSTSNTYLAKTDQDLPKEKSSKKVRYAGQDPSNVSIISFDACEVSEQITTV